MINLTHQLAEVLITILMNIYMGLENGGIEVHAEKAGITKQELEGVLEAALHDFGMQGLMSLATKAVEEESKPMPDNVVVFPSTPIEA